MVGRIWEGLMNACLNPVSSNTDYVPSCLCITFMPLFPPAPCIFRKELIAKLDQAEKEKVDAAQLAREFEALTEENQTLKLAQSQCVEQLEKLRIQYQKRQGSS